MPQLSAPDVTPIQARTRWFVALGTLASTPVFASLAADPIPALVVGLGWVLGLALLAELTRHRRLRAETSDSLAAALAALCFPQLVYLTGGTQSPLYVMMFVLPLVQSVVAPGQIKAVVLAIAGPLIAQVYFAITDAGLVHASVFAGFAVLSLFALRGSHQYRKLRDAERQATRAQVDALAKLSLSERRRSEVERLAQIGHLAAGVAHEINNPLAFAAANLRFVREELADPDSEREEIVNAAKEAQDGLDRIRQIVCDLKNFSRTGVEGDEADRIADVARVVREATRLASVRTRGVATVEVALPPELPLVMSHPRELSQVLLNLIVNAADAIAAAPRTDDVPTIRVGARLERSDGTLAIEIEDSGPGVPEHLHDRIFDPFFTTKPPGQGTGLGLALSREYVERSGGSLQVTHAHPCGAKFVVTLRVAEANAASSIHLAA